MRLLFALIIAGICASPVFAGEAAAPSPGFSWDSKYPAAKSNLRQAELKWREAAAVPTTPDWLKSKNKAFDEAYLREILGRKDFAYDLLDVAMTKLKRIEECKAYYAKAVSAAGSFAPAARGFDDPYYLLKSRIRLAIGLSRAEISRQMMGDENSGYCFQAMESAIDALRDAAADADKISGGAARAEHIRKLRAGLFDVWEAAQGSKDTELIGRIDLLGLWDSSGLAKQTDKK